VKRIGWAVATVLAVVLIGGAFMFVTTLLRQQPPEIAGTLARPAPGEIRADYLADGTPVWVVGDDGGAIRVLWAISTHRPANVGTMLWWCEAGEAFEDAASGSRYDAGGFKFYGPAPTGLPAYEITVVGSAVQVGDLQPAPPPDAGPGRVGQPDVCFLRDVTFHTFEGWPVHESPIDAVASEPDGWILLAGELAVIEAGIFMCAIDTCVEAAPVDGIDENIFRDQLSPFRGTRFIARVRDGALVDVTRALPVNP
jgi:hypothetical protein